MSLTLITGGARSGKSTFAENLAKDYAQNRGMNGRGVGLLYIATAVPFDEEMKERIRLHQEQRSKDWRTVEAYQQLDQVIAGAMERVILLDCITVMITNLIFESELDEDKPTVAQTNQVEEKIMAEITNLLEAVKKHRDKEIILVTNELGMGLVPPYPLGRIFRDIAGRANQRLASASDQVYFVISGIPTQIKGGR